MASGAYDTLVVGAGFAGSILARELAERLEHRVLVIDRREHIAGNAFDQPDEHGTLIHRYGPHIFHTNSDKVVEHLSRFTDWTPYEHRVLARVGERLVPMPINRTTLNELYAAGLSTDAEAEAFLAARAEPVERIRNSEDAVVAKVGRDLYERLFRGYTRKQWNRDPAELSASVCARIPVRTGTDDRYFTDRFQAMPADGYTRMFERILDHPLIEVALRTDFAADIDGEIAPSRLVWTGPIDAFFGHRLGALPYRSLEFEFQTRPTPDGGYVQPATQINEPSEDVPHTRTTEFRRFRGQTGISASTVALEYPRDAGEPYYPIPSPESRALYRRYEGLAAERPDVTFVGRLARYQYLNMDQVVGQALAVASRLIERESETAWR
ncbi:UDP-galactopyranose mutase [Thermoleophilia bacterium SCSIO 60948]|nr:UDP-galactopyranose mutase [Thermoleophilia bacterium SCSIO 60948]